MPRKKGERRELKKSIDLGLQSLSYSQGTGCLREIEVLLAVLAGGALPVLLRAIQPAEHEVRSPAFSCCLKLY